MLIEIARVAESKLSFGYNDCIAVRKLEVPAILDLSLSAALAFIVRLLWD